MFALPPADYDPTNDRILCAVIALVAVAWLVVAVLRSEYPTRKGPQ